MDYRSTAALLDSLGLALCVFDANDRTVLWNQHFLHFFPEHAGHVHVGEPYADNLRRFYLQRLPPDDLAHMDRYVRDGIHRHHTQTRSYVFTHRGRRLRVAATAQANGDRARIWMDLSGAELGAPSGAGAALQGELPAPETLRLFEHLGDGVSVHDAAGRIVFANERLLAMYGLDHKNDALGRTYGELVQQRWERSTEAAEHPDAAADISAALRDSLQFVGAPFEVPLPGGRWTRVTMNPTADAQTCGFHVDISASKHAETQLRALTDRLRQETHRDVLTGLHNRRGLDAMVRELALQTGSHGLLFIDLDGFKAVNDSAGHATGDTVLRQVAHLLQQSVRAERDDAVIRIGGDEFVVLLRGCEARHAQAVGQKIVDAIAAAAFGVEGAGFRLGASIGVRIFSGLADSPDVLLHDADTTCYRAKRGGRGKVEVFGHTA